MDVRIYPSSIKGFTEAISPKNAALRTLLAASLSREDVSVKFNNRSAEIFAAMQTLTASFAEVTREGSVYTVKPKEELPSVAEINLGGGAAALRFLLAPLTAAGFKRINVTGDGGVLKRVLKELCEKLRGVILTGETTPATITGKLKGGIYEFDESVPSGFIDGLIFALAMTKEGGEIRLSEKEAESKHVLSCVKAVNEAGKKAEISGGRIIIFGREEENGFSAPKIKEIAGEPLSAAPFYAAKILGGDIEIGNVSDKKGEEDIIRAMNEAKNGGVVGFKGISAAAPFAAVCAAFSNRVCVIEKAFSKPKDGEAMEALKTNLVKMGASAEVTENGIKITGTGGLKGGVYVDGFGNARVAAATAVAAIFAKEPTVLLSAEAANKEYPEFFNELIKLGARIESL